ncbi:MAG: hypothetical protein ACON4U_02795 [Myxococcota bacterium]
MQSKRLFIFDFIISLGLIWPIFGRRIDLLGSEQVDVWNHAWGPWWWAHQLSEGSLPWHTNLLQGPEGGTLWFIDPILAVLGAPFALFSPALGFGFALLLYFAFASAAIRYFARTVGAGTETQWIASIAFVWSAWVLSEAHNGITEAVNIGPVALALGAIASAHKESTLKKWAFAGLCIGLSAACSPYLGLGTGIVAVVFGLRHFKHAWVGALIAAVTAIPNLMLFRLQLAAEDAIIKRPPGMNETLALHNAVDPRTFFAPFGFQSVDLSSEGFTHSLYLGLIATALMLKIIWRHPLWLMALLISMLCALGPYLYWEDGWFVSGGARFRLPWFYLQSLFPGLAVTHPLRLGIPALAICAAFAATSLEQSNYKKHWKWVAAFMALDGLVFSGSPYPLSTANAEIPEIYQDINNDASSGMVLDLPTDAGETMRTSRYLYYQTTHHKPIPYAPDVRASTSSLLRYGAFQELAALCQRRADEHQRLGFGQARGQEANVKSLAAAGVRWIVLHPDIDPSVTSTLKQRIEADLGPAPVQQDGVLVWKLDGAR